MTEPTIQEVQQDAQQAAQSAAQAAQEAKQVAQQVAEQIGQAVSQAISKALQTFAQTTGGSAVYTRQEMADIGGSERLEKDQMNESGLLFANAKRTYDEYQQESIESIKRNRSYVDNILANVSAHDNRTRVIAEQALQNAVESANMISKQAVAHRDIAIDHEWNVDEQGYQAASIIDSMNSPAVKQAMAATIADILAEMAAAKKV